jgi:hypothetical protein
MTDLLTQQLLVNLAAFLIGFGIAWLIWGRRAV